jgi:hypothetical protein
MKMRSKSARIFIVLTVLITVSLVLPQGFSANYSVAYQLLNHLGESTYYRLNVAVSESLHQYYVEKSHRLILNNDFAKFVTPYALKPLADSLWEIYVDDEDFANGVLMIVHQIPYEESKPPEYPVETIVGNKGDCDLFSYVAASIMKAGGLDVVLLYYESEAHMNIGVSLSHAPHDINKQVDYVLHSGVKFYVAECTGENWQNGWRVGECPESLRNASVQVVTLENCEQIAPGQVSASYKALRASTISLSLSAGYIIQGGSIILSGEISPSLENETVTIYMKVNNLPWTALGLATTDSLGRFIYLWNVQASGISYVRASWSGDDDYAAADSSTRTLMAFPVFFILLVVITVILAGVGTVVFFTSRHSRKEIREPQPPEIPS